MELYRPSLDWKSRKSKKSTYNNFRPKYHLSMGHYLYSYFFKPKICIQLSPFVQRNCKIEIRQFVEMHICKCVSIANRRCGIRSAIFSLACSFLLLLVVTGLSGVVNCDRNCARQVLHLKLKYNKSFPEKLQATTRISSHFSPFGFPHKSVSVSWGHKHYIPLIVFYLSSSRHSGLEHPTNLSQSRPFGSLPKRQITSHPLHHRQ